MTPADVPAPCFSQPIIFEIFKLYRSVDIWDNISLSVFFLRDPPGKHKTSKLIGQPVGPHNQDMCKDLFNVTKWGCKAANDFFRDVYCGRLWLTRMEAEECIYNGWAMCDPLFAFYFYTCFFGERSLLQLPASQWHENDSSHLVISKEAYGCCSVLSSEIGWALFYVRPKIHMFCHLLLLSCSASFLLFLLYVLMS